MQIMKQLKYCLYLDFFIILGLLLLKIYVSNFFLKEKNKKLLMFNIVYFPDFKISAFH